MVRILFFSPPLPMTKNKRYDMLFSYKLTRHLIIKNIKRSSLRKNQIKRSNQKRYSVNQQVMWLNLNLIKYVLGATTTGQHKREKCFSDFAFSEIVTLIPRGQRTEIGNHWIKVKPFTHHSEGERKSAMSYNDPVIFNFYKQNMAMRFIHQCHQHDGLYFGLIVKQF